MPIEKDKLHNILQSKFPEAQIEITALVDDNDHYSVVIKDSIFNDKSRIEQQRLVNKALGDLLKGELHAMQLKTIPNS